MNIAFCFMVGPLVSGSSLKPGCFITSESGANASSNSRSASRNSTAVPRQDFRLPATRSRSPCSYASAAAALIFRKLGAPSELGLLCNSFGLQDERVHCFRFAFRLALFLPTLVDVVAPDEGSLRGRLCTTKL